MRLLVLVQRNASCTLSRREYALSLILAGLSTASTYTIPLTDKTEGYRELAQHEH